MVGKLTPNDMMSCSRLPALLGFSKFRTPNDELKQSIEHYQGIEPEFIENEPMLWGNLTEKLILAEAVKRLGCEIDNLDDFGQYHADDRKILLGHKATLSRAVLIETIRHEMVHAALDIGGVSYNKVMEEESIVRCLDTLFHPSWEKVRSTLIK